MQEVFKDFLDTQDIEEDNFHEKYVAPTYWIKQKKMRKPFDHTDL